MTGSKLVFLGCLVSLDEQDRLCEVSVGRSAIEEVSKSIRTADREHLPSIYLRVEVRREGDAPSDPISILDDAPSVTVTLMSIQPQTPEQPEKRPRPGSYVEMTE